MIVFPRVRYLDNNSLFLNLVRALLLFFLLTKQGFAEEWPEPVPQQVLGVEYSEAKAHIDKKRWPEAVVVLRKLYQDKPSSIPVILDLAYALAYLGRREEALNILIRTAQSSQGKKKQFFIRRVQVLSETFLTNETFQKYQNGIHFLTHSQLREARSHLLRALKDEPDNVEILFRQAQAFLLDGDFDSAVNDLFTAEKLNPYRMEIKLWLGRALMWKNNTTVGLEKLKESFIELKGNDLAATWYAEALLAVGQRKSAIDILESQSKKYPLSILSLMSLAKFRLSATNASKSVYWKARSDLQLALSRFDDYSFQPLQLIPSSPDKLKKEIETLLRDIENRIQTSSAPQVE